MIVVSGFLPIMRCRLRVVAPLVLSTLTIVVAAGVAFSGLIATAGGRDQRSFHYPSVLAIIAGFPDIDIANLRTATGPLYHLILAAVAGPLHLSEAGVQTISAAFSAALAALVLVHTSVAGSRSTRFLAAAPLVCSPYFWQSALWMLTDNAALLFGSSAWFLLMRRTGQRTQWVAGVLLAGAIATRQTSIWMLAPAVVLVIARSRSCVMQDISAVVLRICAPGAVVLCLLVSMWGGLTPPAMRNFNDAGQSWVSLSFAAAVSVVFLLPILGAIGIRRCSSRSFGVGAVVGIALAVPAIVFPSSATVEPDQSRRGGLVWTVAGHFPSVSDRSPLIVGLAFVGGVAATLVCCQTASWCRAFAIASFFSLSIVNSMASQMYQKYFELSLAIVAVILITYLFVEGRIVRRLPLILLVIFQMALCTVNVLLPLAHAGGLV